MLANVLEKIRWLLVQSDFVLFDLITCPKYMSLFLLFLFIKDVVTFICCCINALVPFSIHAIHSIFRQHQFSKASIFLMSAFLSVRVSAPCVATGQTNASISFTFVSILTSFLLQILSNPTTAALPKASLFLISSLQSPFSVIIEPRKLKLETISSSSLP